MTPAVILPFRDRGNDPLRLANLRCAQAHWESLGFPVLVVGDGRQGDAPFNRSAAYNQAARSTDADVLIYVEADFIVPHEQIRQAVELAARGRGVVVPFTDYHTLTAEDSELVRAGKDPAECPRSARVMSEFGPANVMSRDTLDAVGCWDEGFEGHGYDDLAMNLAFELAAGPVRFVGGPGYHLHHLPGYDGEHLSNADRAAIAGNKQRYRLYQQVKHKAAQEIRQFTRGEICITARPTGKIVLGIPLYRWVPAAFFSRFLSMDYSPVAATIAIDGAYVIEAFNTIVQRALMDIPGWDRLVIMEHDMITGYDALVRMASYSAEYPVVGGFYFNRGTPHNALVYIEQDGEYQSISPSTAKAWIDTPGLYRCDGIGFGLVSFARHVLADWPKDVPMFDTRDDCGSHDLYFCRQARLLGHDIFVDSGTVADHLGEVRIGLEHNQSHAHPTDSAEVEFVR